ncbi:M56 family metallopeptidase [Niabella yanshanensis]|uniref:M56 family metallopeptidase n=1 Tax=Niabella yanshanensis TaxID=577386 RepID=A0ABZ0W826_9BACT|nr:M56 family metallopeptidase [Niabella yanshanensis]WQD39438.1 M56 family metallopeptidase [Niabella yanshanensis]
MLVYLLKMIACSAAFYGLYLLLFRNEKMFVFNRFYLLASLVISFIIPVVSFTVYTTYNVSYTVDGAEQPVTEFNKWIDDGMTALAFISTIGSVILLARFIRNLACLKRRASNSEQLLDFKGAKIILLREPVVPHSFLNKIYLNSNEYREHHIETEVLEHELAHVQQKHSWDILFVELLHVFCWFNPFIYLYKRSIKINHELLADAAVVKQLGDVRSYQVVLLQRATAQSSLALVSSFNFFTIKKRMTMLTKKTNPYHRGLRSISVLPMLAILVFLFAERSYAQKETPEIIINDVKSEKRDPNELEGVKSVTLSAKDRKIAQIKLNYDNGRIIEEDVSTPEKAEAFEKKYGIELPPPPPPNHKKKMAVPAQPPAAPRSPNKIKSIPRPATSSSKLSLLTKMAEEELMILSAQQNKEILKPAIPTKKEEQLISFNPPVIIKDKEAHSSPTSSVATTKKIKRFDPPVIVKDDEMHK